MCVLALQQRQAPKVVKRQGNAALVPQLFIEAQALLKEPPRRRVVALFIGQIAQTAKDRSDAHFVAQFPMEAQTLFQ